MKTWPAARQDKNSIDSKGLSQRILAPAVRMMIALAAVANLNAQSPDRAPAPSALPPPPAPAANEPRRPADTRTLPRAESGTQPRTAFSALPRGIQTFDGVTFHIRKPVNIIGARAARAKGQEFARVTDSTIQGRGGRIHVLHTGDHGSSPTGNYIWRLVLHYADGETRRFDFAYGIHIRNFWRRPGESQRTPEDPNSSIAWIGTSVESDRTGAELVVSRTTLQNPRPEVEVTSADFVSLLGQSSAYVLGVTISDDGPEPLPDETHSAPHVRPLTFVFKDADGQPLLDATLGCVFLCDGFSVRLAPAGPDAMGRVTLDVPMEFVSAIQYQARQGAEKIEKGTVEVAPDDKGLPEQVIRFSE